MFACGREGFCAGMRAKLGVEVGKVRFDRSSAEKQPVGHVLSGQVLGEQRKYFLFAGSQLDWRGGQRVRCE